MANGNKTLRQIVSVATLTVGLAMAVPLFAQDSEPAPMQGSQTERLAEYQKALAANPQSSLANYRIAELLFIERQYQSSAFAFRFALHGDGNPKWTKVWSYIGLGKIFDLTEQRDRAVIQYQLAVQTNENTQGAVDEARKLLQERYKLPDTL